MILIFAQTQGAMGPRTNLTKEQEEWRTITTIGVRILYYYTRTDAFA